MKSFINYLNEKRKNPDQNPKETYWDILNKHKDDPNIYVTLTQEKKVGINPHSKNTTPNGIYTYPLKSFWKIQPGYAHKNKYLLWDDFIKDAKYIYVLKAKCKMVDVAKFSKSDYQKDMVKLKKLQKNGYILPKWTSDQFEQLLQMSDKELESRDKNYYRKLINTINYIAFTKEPPSIWKSKEMNLGKGKIVYHNKEAQQTANILRKLGYGGFVDNGNGYIHNQEPTQAYFLSKEGFTVIDKLQNKTPRVQTDTLKGRDDFARNYIIKGLTKDIKNPDFYRSNDYQSVINIPTSEIE